MQNPLPPYVEDDSNRENQIWCLTISASIIGGSGDFKMIGVGVEGRHFRYKVVYRLRSF